MWEITIEMSGRSARINDEIRFQRSFARKHLDPARSPASETFDRHAVAKIRSALSSFSRQEVVKLAPPEYSSFVFAPKLQSPTLRPCDDRPINPKGLRAHFRSHAQSIQKVQRPGRKATAAGLGSGERLLFEEYTLHPTTGKFHGR